MAMIPDTFVPSVTTAPIGASPMSAQPVQPMQNRAPEQQIQAGQTVQKLGEEVNNIGERIQYQLDDSMTKEAESKFLQQATVIANGDGKDNPGYLHTIGKDAITALPDAQTALAKAKQDGLEGLANPYQKMMYNRVASQHLASFGAQFADHHFQQQTQYSGNEAVNRASIYGDNASLAHASYGSVDGNGNPTGDFATYLKVAEDETLNAAHILHGVPLGTVQDPGSATAEAALRNIHSVIAIGTLTNMMDGPEDKRSSYAKVQQTYDEMQGKGWLTPEASKQLGQMVKAFADGEQIRVVNAAALADAYRASLGQATTSTGTPDYVPMPVKGAGVTSSGYDADRGDVIISVPPGSQIQAPASGKVIQAGADPDGNFGVKIQHPDGSITSFDGLQSTNVKLGDQVLRGDSIATTGVPLDSNKPGITWALADKNGVSVDPTKAGLPPVDLSKITDEKVLQNAITDVRTQITDPKLQDEAVRQLGSIVRHNQSEENAGKLQIYQQATEAFYKGGMNVESIPPSIRGQINAEELQHFKDLQTSEIFKRYDEQQKFKELNGETDVVAHFLTNPESLTVDNVNAKRAQLSNSTYISMIEKAEALQNNPKGVIEASAVATRTDYWAEHNGIPTQGTLSKTQRETLVDLRKRIADDVEMAKSQNHGKVTGEQVDSIIQQEVLQKTLAVPRGTWSPMRMFTPTYDLPTRRFEIPNGTKSIVRAEDGKKYYVDANGNKLGVVTE